MGWRTLTAVAVVTWATTGCRGEPKSFLDNDAILGNSSLTPAEAPVARSQQPDVEPAKRPPVKTLLDLPPQRQDKGEKGVVKARIQATVNGVPILEEEVMEQSYPFILALKSKGASGAEFDKALADIYSKQLNDLIDYELLLQDAVAKLSVGSGKQGLEKLKQAGSREFDQLMRKRRLDLGIKTEEEFRKALEEHQVSLEGMRKQYERQFLAKEYLRYLVGGRLDEAIGHPQIQEYYQKHPEEFIAFDSVDWYDLFIDPTAARFKGSRDEARAFAKQVVGLVRQGSDFKEFVQYDNGDSKTREGHGLGRRRGEIQPPEVEELLFRMRDGEVSDVIELTGGFHVIKLISRQHAGQRPFNEKVQAEVKDKLRVEIGSREVQAILRELRGRAVIEIADSSK